MGCCVSKRPAKVKPHASHVHLVQTKLHVQNKSQKTPETKCFETDNASIERENGRCSPDCSPSDHQKEGAQSVRDDIQVSSQVKQNLPPLKRTADSCTPKLAKAVAFDINFNKMDTNSKTTSKIFPRRLKKLEGVSQLTAEQLRTKQELAELNRSKELQRKTETSSKHNRDIFQAREDQRQRNAQMQMEQKFLARERNRDNHVTEVINKQRKREQKAKKVREKSCVELEESVVHVETYCSADSSADEDWGDEARSPENEDGAEDEKKRTGDEGQDESSTDEFFDT